MVIMSRQKSRMEKHFKFHAKCGLIATLLLVILPKVSLSEEQSAFEVEKEIKGDGTEGPYHLDDYLIIKGGEEVWVDSVLKARSKDYEIDYVSGQITFSDKVPRGATIRAKFKRVPLDLRRVYRHRKIAALEETEENPRPVQEFSESSPHKKEDLSALKVGGSKTFGITVGSNRDLSLDQALRVDISGKIGENLEVLALLSDQNIPIQPEGNTQTLRELDRVLVQIKADNLAAALGDIELSFRDAEFGRYERRIGGVRGDILLPQAKVTVAGAISQGQFITKKIQPIEGNQGPYQLTAENGNDDIVVLAGTEKVWLDGELLTRGENNDYTIEYGSGQITFTGRHLITSDSRIVVDYQYTDRRFKRNLIAGQARTNILDGKIKLGATLIRESDAGDGPMGFDLSESDREVIKEAGDAPALAWRSDVEVDSLNGRASPEGAQARRVEDPLTSWMEPHRPSFSWVGDGKGDYRYLGGGIYEYAGPGQGSYISGVLLPFAISHQLTAFDFSLTPARDLEITGEAALSDLDKNLLSPKDDEDNLGRAYKVTVRMGRGIRAFGGDAGHLKLFGEYRFVGSSFRPLGRTRDVEDNRRWGLDLMEKTAGETSQELRGTYRPTESLGLSLEYGRMRRGDTFESKRRQVAVFLSEPRISYSLELIDRIDPASSGKIMRQHGRADHTFWKLKPEILFESEKIGGGLQQSSLREPGYTELEGRMSSVGWGALEWSSSYGVRRTHTTDQAPSDHNSIARTQRYRLVLHKWRSLSLSGEYSHRRKSFSGSDQKSDLARFTASFSPQERAITGDLHYEVSRARMAMKKRNFLDVGWGRGSYRWEDLNGDGLRQEEEYIPDPYGDHILYVEEVGDFEPITDLTAGAGLKLDPGRLFKNGKISLWRKVLSGLSSDTSLKVGRKARRPSGLKEVGVGPLDILRFPTEGTVIRGRRTVRQDLHLFRYSRPFSLRMRYRREDDLNRMFSTEGVRNLSIQRSLRGRSHLPVGVDLEVEYTNRKRFRDGRSQFDFDVVSDKLSIRGAYRPLRGMETSLKLAVGRDKDEDPREDVVARLISLEPQVSYSLKGRGRLRLRADWTRVSSQPDDASLIFQLAEGKRRGDNFDWNLGFDYRLGQYVTSFVSYSGRKSRAKEEIHSMRAEMRAFF